MEPNHVIDFRYAPPSRWTSICLPDDPYKSLVREDGALLYGFQSDAFHGWQFRRVYEFGISAAHGPEAVDQVMETPRFPCVVTTLRYAKATLELRTFAWQHDGGRRTDVVLWSITAHPEVDEFLTGLRIDAYELSRVFTGRSIAPARVIFVVDVDQKPAYEFMSSTSRLLVEDESWPAPGEVAFVSSPHRLVRSHTGGFRPCSGLATEPVVLRGGESLRGALLIPQNHQETDGLDLAWAERAYAEARRFWEELPLLRLPIQLPDADLMDMIEACARNILQAREVKDGLPVFQVGPTVYRGLWVVDGHFLLEAAQYLGYREDAYSGVDTLLKRVKPDGSIVEMPHHIKETGISIMTLVRQCELMGDEARLRELWPVIRNAVLYIEELRRQASELPEDSPCYRLLPMAFGDGGLGGMRAEYTTTFWVLAGLKAAANAARRLGIEADAARVEADFESLLADFRAHAERDQRRLPDGTPYLPINKPGSSDHVWIPDYPGEAPVAVRLTPASATWAFCHAIYPGEVFSPDDPLVQNLLCLYDQLDDEEGVPVSTGWIPYRALWNYHASFAAHAWLYAGRGDKAADYLYAFANHATPTRVWREEQSLTSSEHGQLVGDMPHNWASAEFIRLVRHLVVFEGKDGLDFLAGVPAEWRAPGGVVAFERTPTRYGPVTLRLETAQTGRFRLEIEVDPAWSLKPEVRRVLLDAEDIHVNGTPLPAGVSGWIELPLDDRIRVEGVWKR